MNKIKKDMVKMSRLEGFEFIEVNNDELKIHCFNCNRPIYSEKISESNEINVKIFRNCPICGKPFNRIAGQFYK